MKIRQQTLAGPHQGQPVLLAGAPLAQAHGALILLHGRGAPAEDILGLVDYIGQPGLAYLAPQAAELTWYPQRFLAPLAANEPWLSSALAAIGDLFDQLVEAGIAPERTLLGGFSQGACLSLEYAARHPRRYGAIVGLSGGLIGPPGTRWPTAGTLDGTPTLLGCSDIDVHIPVERVHESATVLAALGATVTTRIYPGMGHTINQEELQLMGELAASVATP